MGLRHSEEECRRPKVAGHGAREHLRRADERVVGAHAVASLRALRECRAALHEHRAGSPGEPTAARASARPMIAENSASEWTKAMSEREREHARSGVDRSGDGTQRKRAKLSFTSREESFGNECMSRVHMHIQGSPSTRLRSELTEITNADQAAS